MRRDLAAEMSGGLLRRFKTPLCLYRLRWYQSSREAHHISLLPKRSERNHDANSLGLGDFKPSSVVSFALRIGLEGGILLKACLEVAARSL